MDYRGKVETCVLGGLTKYDIIKNMEEMILAGGEELEKLGRELNQKLDCLI